MINYFNKLSMDSPEKQENINEPLTTKIKINTETKILYTHGNKPTEARYIKKVTIRPSAGLQLAGHRPSRHRLPPPTANKVDGVGESTGSRVEEAGCHSRLS